MNKSKKLYFKIGLDLIMLLLLVTFFNKRVISMSFHEVGGIIFFLLFIVHIVLNGDWIKSVTAKLFKKGTGAKLIISWIINILLLVVLTGIIITGISMNKTLPIKLSIINRPQQLHYFFSALLIILMGVHLGLHWTMFKGLAAKTSCSNKRPVRIIILVILSLTVILGCYNLASGSFFRWISGPFGAKMEGNFQMREGFHGDFEGMEKPDMTEDSDAAIDFNVPDKSSFKDEAMEKGPGEGMGNGKMNMGPSMGMDRSGSENFSILNLLQVMFTYFSEMTLFAFVTILISKIKKRIKP